MIVSLEKYCLQLYKSKRRVSYYQPKVDLTYPSNRANENGYFPPNFQSLFHTFPEGSCLAISNLTHSGARQTALQMTDAQPSHPLPEAVILPSLTKTETLWRTNLWHLAL